MSPVVVRGDVVSLRPFRPGEVDLMLEIFRRRADEDGSPTSATPSRSDVLERIEGSGTWSDGPVGLLLAIEADGRLVGEIQARGGRAQLLPPGVFELGIELFEPADRRRGLGTAAVVEAARYLFDHEGARRVQISTDVDNAAMRRTCERAGFRFEGVLRGFFPDGDPARGRDYAMYAMTRADYEDVGGAWISTG